MWIRFSIKGGGFLYDLNEEYQAPDKSILKMAVFYMKQVVPSWLQPCWHHMTSMQLLIIHSLYIKYKANIVHYPDIPPFPDVSGVSHILIPSHPDGKRANKRKSLFSPIKCVFGDQITSGQPRHIAVYQWRSRILFLAGPGQKWVGTFT